MYDGNQVLRVVNNYKMKDLYNIGNEMQKRKGTGNYDKERTKFNVEYVSINEKNLYQEIKQKLKNNNIEYLNKATTNMLNGITFSSGTEFFQSLGMKFKDSGRTYHSGNKKGQSVLIPDIKNEKDIPNSVTYFFDSCMEFLKQYVGEENIVLAQIHYDEDTPHLQAYFMPIVDTVKRKVYEKDSNGNVIKEEITKKDGTKSLVPKIKRDKDGKIIYEIVKGNILNCDQFWKQRGAQHSFHQMQNEFNKFITDKGFNLFRGNIGNDKEHQTKMEYQIQETKEELKELNKEKNNILKIIENSKNCFEEINKNKDKEILNPIKRKIGGYKEEDINNIIDYSKELEKQVFILSIDNENKDIVINSLSEENKTFKNNNELIKRNDIIKEQKKTINHQKKEISRLNDLINVLNNNINDLREKFNEKLNKYLKIIKKMCNAIDKILGRKSTNDLQDYEDLADSIIDDYYNKDNKSKYDDREIGI